MYESTVWNFENYHTEKYICEYLTVTITTIITTVTKVFPKVRPKFGQPIEYKTLSKPS